MPEPVENAEVKSPSYDLSKFRLKRILTNNSVRKSISLLGTFPDISETDDAIVVFEKNAYRESDVATPESPSEESPKKPSVKSTVIYPATDKHIEKYSVCQKYLIRETPDLYQKITLPYLTSSQFSLEWVYNILEHKQEKERIVFEDADPETGFILLPDLKWDGRNVENLYLLGIIHKHDIKSLRDLNGSHLDLLRNLRQASKDAISKRYGLNPNQLRMYFHYQPSFYHLHVHINPVRNDAPGIWCEKSHMLDTVINNLELLPDYYQRATLPFVLYEGNKLLDLYEQEQPIRKVAVLSDDKEQAEQERTDPAATEGFSDVEPEERQCKRIKLATPEPKEAEATVQSCA
ncbi:hypothetical protein M5D96_000817 [Drosophila gunungcola]|uniref:m7GpppX diphosphatase n=1 Tax=Drosophila gunungcola TaxID=103775 RepID=A0A9Q0BUG6_9MUSC|nr:hypothetical protein M5D96_000817 [Drosophila gunungcola]